MTRPLVACLVWALSLYFHLASAGRAVDWLTASFAPDKLFRGSQNLSYITIDIISQCILFQRLRKGSGSLFVQQHLSSFYQVVSPAFVVGTSKILSSYAHSIWQWGSSLLFLQISFCPPSEASSNCIWYILGFLFTFALDIRIDVTVPERWSGCSIDLRLGNDSGSRSNTRALMTKSSARLMLGLIGTLIGGVHASAAPSKSAIWLSVRMVARLTYLVDKIADQRATLGCRVFMVCTCILCRCHSTFCVARSLEVNWLKNLLQLETLLAGRLRVEDSGGSISIFSIFLCWCLTLLSYSRAQCTIDLIRASLLGAIILRLFSSYTHPWCWGHFLCSKGSLLRC